MLLLAEPFDLPLECVQGDSFQTSLTIQDDGVNVNFTGMTSSFIAVLGTSGNPKISITTSTGITLGDGTMAIAIDDAVTAGYKPGVYVYQWSVSDATDTQTWFRGNFTIKERKQ